MAKVRQPQHRVLPPLPQDSRLHERVRELGIDPTQHAVYELRPYPSSTLASDETLRHKIAEKETPKWPVVTSSPTLKPMIAALAEGRELKPFSAAYRVDGQQGVALSFPLLVLKNVPEPLSGGYLVNRFFVRGSKPVDIQGSPASDAHPDAPERHHSLQSSQRRAETELEARLRSKCGLGLVGPVILNRAYDIDASGQILIEPA